MYMHTLVCFCESRRCFFSPLSLKYITYSFFFPSLLPAFPLLVLRSCCACALELPVGLLCVLLPCVRHSSAVRRKTVWQCGQMHRVYVPGLISSCLCAAVCSVARSVCVSCCRVSSGGNNSRYASISRAAAIRCSVCNVILLLSMAIRKVWRCTPIRRDSSTTPTPAAFMCSRM